MVYDAHFWNSVASGGGSDHMEQFTANSYEAALEIAEGRMLTLGYSEVIVIPVDPLKEDTHANG